MDPIQSIDDIEQALRVKPFHEIPQVAVEKLGREQSLAFKTLLLDIIARKVLGSEDVWARKRAFWTLGGYFMDHSLIDLCVDLLDDASMRYTALRMIVSIGYKQPALFQGYPSIAPPLMRVWQEDPSLIDHVIEAFGVANCVEAIDFILPYLNDPNPYAFISAIKALAPLGKAAGREDIYDKLMPLVGNSYPRKIREYAAAALHMHYPERYTDQQWIEFVKETGEEMNEEIKKSKRSTG